MHVATGEGAKGRCLPNSTTHASRHVRPPRKCAAANTSHGAGGCIPRPWVAHHFSHTPTSGGSGRYGRPSQQSRSKHPLCPCTGFLQTALPPSLPRREPYRCGVIYAFKVSPRRTGPRAGLGLTRSTLAKLAAVVRASDGRPGPALQPPSHLVLAVANGELGYGRRLDETTVIG